MTIEELHAQIDQLKAQNYQLSQQNERLAFQLKRAAEEGRFGLHWLDVPEDFGPEAENALPILKEVKEYALHTPDGKPTHVLIEGENYHALQCLCYTHEGKIDVIYIDPPYNTGNDGFRYRDKRLLKEYPDGTPVPKESPLRHSYWLSFMHKRLQLAQKLLSDKGVIFISIDDNEVAQLKLLCDEVFEERNFIIDVIWQSRKSVSNDTFISLSHNHTLVLAKCLETLRKDDFRVPAYTGEKFSNPDNDPRGSWVADPFDAPNLRPNLTYGIVNPNTGKVFWPPKGRCWRTGEDEYRNFLADNRIVFGKKGKTKPQLKRFLTEAENKGGVLTSIWNDIETTTNGTKLLQNIFKTDKVFNNPKPIGLVKRVFQLASQKNSTVLDFFAGSGTTLHATMALNAEDGGQRQCILVTNNENNICEEVCYERNRRIMQGYTNAKGQVVAPLGNSLNYYRVGFVGKNHAQRANDEDLLTLAHHAGELLALAENTLYEIVSTDAYQIFSNYPADFDPTQPIPTAQSDTEPTLDFGDVSTAVAFSPRSYTGIYFQEDLGAFEMFCALIREYSKEETSVYVFSWSEGEFDEYFEPQPNVRVKSIPEPILKIYRSINQN
ncbi:DNA methyltransferase [Runella sp.]|uniref:DNA methyltransferase n=1 Tax=Runella sp. TaxID=1960881 RepID=UPI00260D9818|nr:DNA methyltransferase [Runella sp.]